MLGRRAHLLLVYERSRLPIVLPVRAVRELSAVFPDAVRSALLDVGIPAAVVDDECARMSESVVGRTRNRSLVGTMTDYALMAQHVDRRRVEPETPREVVRFLRRTPIQPMGGANPSELTRAAFG